MQNPKFNFMGLDHVALSSSNMARTVAFYNGKLGMPILHSIEYLDADGSPTGQHYFFGVGSGEAHIAFFYWKKGYQNIPEAKPNSDETKKAADLHPLARPIGDLDHINLRVEAAHIARYCELLTAEGIAFTHTWRREDPERPGVLLGVTTENGFSEPAEDALMSSVYFVDPDGINLEFNAWFPRWANWRYKHVPWG
ncbi:MAG: VOC family protein [Lautropia sp.]